MCFIFDFFGILNFKFIKFFVIIILELNKRLGNNIRNYINLDVLM